MASATSYQPINRANNSLRRAKYVNVLELVLSQYDLNRSRLHDELAKLRAERDTEDALPPVVGGDDDADELAVERDDTATHIEDAAAAGGGSTGIAKHDNARAATNLSVLPGGPSIPPEKHHQSRLQPPRDGFNLCLLVGRVEIVVDKRRVDGSRVLVAEVEVGDETGSISVRARDEQIDLLRGVSDESGAVVLRNCTMELYLGKYLRLAVTKWGKLRAYPDGIESTPRPPSRINRDLNLSLVDLNTVATAKMPDVPHFPIPVATIRHKHTRKQQHEKYCQDSSSPRATPSNRGRSRGSGGNYVHQKKERDDWQERQQQRRNSAAESTARQLLFQNPNGGESGSPPSFRAPQQMHYQQQYGDAGSVYSYQSQHQEHQVGGPSSHTQYVPEDPYSRQQYNIYLQYHDLHLRHAHQLMLLQQQQESQLRILEQRAAAAHSSLIGRVDSHESGGGYSVHTPGGGPDQFGGTLPPSPLSLPRPVPPPPRAHVAMNSEYQYGAPLPSPMNIRGDAGMATYATVSPPTSPAHDSRPAPQAPSQYLEGGTVNTTPPTENDRDKQEQRATCRAVEK
ncbi:hypothetical protein ACHAXA_000681 [Cyclostephanos tholiformis]|uniref:Single-stranded DNA binding protein Ssb-like OB fold domain-containing protein n=1 Tax=Cyclostephanos tholiformis TaxID=382380 RepID=A0ABD3R1E1_9STRA